MTWIELVRRTRATVAAAPPGQRLRCLLNTADKFGCSENILRRSLAAAEKLHEIAKASGLSKDRIAAFPMATVEILGRWMEYDRKGAGAEARRVRAGKTVRQVMASEAQARKRAGIMKRGNGLKLAALQKARQATLAKWPKLDALPDTDAVDMNYISSCGTTALLVFRPSPRMVESRIGEFVQRILGLSLLYSMTIGVVPRRRAAAIGKCWRLHLKTAVRAGHLRRRPVVKFIIVSV